MPSLTSMTCLLLSATAALGAPQILPNHTPDRWWFRRPVLCPMAMVDCPPLLPRSIDPSKAATTPSEGVKDMTPSPLLIPRRDHVETIAGTSKTTDLYTTATTASSARGPAMEAISHSPVVGIQPVVDDPTDHTVARRPVCHGARFCPLSATSVNHKAPSSPPLVPRRNHIKTIPAIASTSATPYATAVVNPSSCEKVSTLKDSSSECDDNVATAYFQSKVKMERADSSEEGDLARGEESLVARDYSTDFLIHVMEEEPISRMGENEKLRSGTNDGAKSECSLVAIAGIMALFVLF